MPQVRVVAMGSLLSGATAIAFFSGGFHERPRLIAGVAAWLLVAVAAAVSPLPRRLGAAALVALALFTAWIGLSYEWAPVGGRAHADVQISLLYLGAFAAAVLLLGGRAARRLVEPGLAIGAVVVTAYGMGDRLLPWLVRYDRSESAGGRMEQPITYWNGLGVVAAMGLVLCIRLAGDGRGTPRQRGCAAAAGVLLTVGLYLTFSRGAILAVVAGAVVLFLTAPDLRVQARAAAIVLGGGGVTSVVADVLPQVSTLPPTTPGDNVQGAVLAVVLAAVTAVCGWLATRLRTGEASARPQWVRGWAAAVGAVAVAGVLVGAGGLLGGEERAGRSRPDPTSAQRFASVQTERYTYWRVSARAFARRPLEGIGAGGFAAEWRRQPGQVDMSADAHSLYIETAAELGLVGLLLLGAFLATVVAAAWRARSRHPAAAAGSAAVFAVWAVHAGVDWDWELPAVTLPALIAAATLLAIADEGEEVADP